MLSTVLDFKKKKTIGESLLFYIVFLLFILTIYYSLFGAVGKSMMHNSEEVAQRAYSLSFWVQPVVFFISVTSSAA